MLVLNDRLLAFEARQYCLCPYKFFSKTIQIEINHSVWISFYQEIWDECDYLGQENRRVPISTKSSSNRKATVVILPNFLENIKKIISSISQTGIGELFMHSRLLKTLCHYYQKSYSRATGHSWKNKWKFWLQNHFEYYRDHFIWINNITELLHYEFFHYFNLWPKDTWIIQQTYENSLKKPAMKSRKS